MCWVVSPYDGTHSIKDIIVVSPSHRTKLSKHIIVVSPSFSYSITAEATDA